MKDADWLLLGVALLIAWRSLVALMREHRRHWLGRLRAEMSRQRTHDDWAGGG